MTQPHIPIGEAASFRQITPKTLTMPQPPRFTFGTFPPDVSAQYYGAMLMHAVGVYAGTGFELCDGYFLQRDERMVVAPDLRIHPAHLNARDPARIAALRHVTRRRIPAAALIISPGHGIFGHWLADILPRLALLEADGQHLDRLLFPVPSDTPKWAIEMMRLFGIPESQILVYGPDEVLKPDELLMPTLIHNGTRYAPILEQAVEIFRRGMAKAGHDLSRTDQPARIFLSRAGGNRRLLNRAQIEAMAVQAGFTLMRPETLSLPEQFTLFANAREIMGEYGSAFHSAMFAPAGTVVCGLRGSMVHPGFLQSGMGDVLGQPTGYVFGQCGTGEATPGVSANDYTVPESAMADCLRIAFGPHANLSTRTVRAPVVAQAAPAPKPAFKSGMPEPTPSQLRGGLSALFRRLHPLYVAQAAEAARPPKAKTPPSAAKPGEMLEGLLKDAAAELETLPERQKPKFGK
jgi:capsular polysaccharide biosynthesis protein